MKKCSFIMIPALLACLSAAGQIRLPAYDTRINPVLMDNTSSTPGYNVTEWPCRWITSPEADALYGVYFFRRELSLPARPESFVIHVSADNRYKLYVNGVQVSAGPAKGDEDNWAFETVDIAPQLKAGSNAVAAVVWNFAELRPVAVMTMGVPGFMVQGNGKAEEVLNTGNGWKVLRSDAYSPQEAKVRGYYAAGCCDRLDAARYPWGWEQAGFDDGSWQEARTLDHAAIKGTCNRKMWKLVPRPIPPMEVLPLKTDRSLDGTVVAAGQTREFLLDNRELTTGYPRLHFSGGRGAKISIGYAESLYADFRNTPYAKNRLRIRYKGDRNVTEGKSFVGYEDVVLPDGGDGRSFEPLWWRTWRYLRLTVAAADEAVTIDSLTAVSSMYPFTLESSFDAPEDPSLQKMLEIGWRTARLCAHETYMDCPYYEQLQYFGDSRIQALVTMFNTRDSCLVRNLLEQGRQSMDADGLVASRYPSNIRQVISPYALFWISTCHDWWMYRGDEKYLRTLLPTMRSTLSWFREYLGSDGLLHGVQSWNFADWADLKNGCFPTDAQGRSAYMDLVHILALRDAADMEEAFGEEFLARQYREMADKAASGALQAYRAPARGLFADNGELKDFSQHNNALAILCGLVSGEEASSLMKRLLSDGNLRPCTIYFRYYLQRAMAASGHGDELIPNLGVLRDQMALGLTTWAEAPEPSRSDCHAWGSSPNIEFFRMVLGIDSAAPGFRKVRVAPCPGPLTKVSGSIPHPAGTVSVALEVGKGSRIRARVSLPSGTDGEFVWGGRTKALHPGENRISL